MLFILFTDSIILTSIARGILILSTNDGENMALELVSLSCSCSMNALGYTSTGCLKFWCFACGLELQNETKLGKKRRCYFTLSFSFFLTTVYLKLYKLYEPLHALFPPLPPVK